MAHRPTYLNLFAIRLPLPGVVSILHRVSGAFLFLAMPALLYLFQQSLVSADQFAALNVVRIKMVALILAAAFIYHACAGIRHLLLDLHIGMQLKAARASSVIVLLVSIALTVIVAVKLW